MVTMATSACSKKYAYRKRLITTLFCCFLPLILLYAETSTSDEADWSETEWDADELFIPIEQFAGRPVVDMAGILTLSEQQEIAARFTEFSESLKTDASVVLVPDTGDLTAEAYADDFFDYGGYGYGEDRDGILLLIVTGYGDGSGRKAHISTSGKRTINTVTASRIDDDEIGNFRVGHISGDERRGVEALYRMRLEGDGGVRRQNRAAQTVVADRAERQKIIVYEKGRNRNGEPHDEHRSQNMSVTEARRSENNNFVVAHKSPQTHEKADESGKGRRLRDDKRKTVGHKLYDVPHGSALPQNIFRDE